jgi:hypothetical protein
MLKTQEIRRVASEHACMYACMNICEHLVNARDSIQEIICTHLLVVLASLPLAALLMHSEISAAAVGCF